LLPPSPSAARRTRSPLWLALSLAVVASGCGPSLQGDVFRGDGFAVRLGAWPATWQRISVGGGALAFRDDAAGATVAVSGRCGRDGEDVPLAALTQHLFLQFTERELREQAPEPFDGREALHTVLSAKLDGVRKVVDVFVLKKNGCVFDLLSVADPTRYDAHAPTFHAFARAFSTVSP
jgi:hypothetical protein